MRQVRDGLAGGACAVLPLLVVNALGYAGLLDTQAALLAGALALFGGPLMGGAVAGILAHRGRGSPNSFTAGIIAGALYLVSLLALVGVAARAGAEPPILAEHPLRVGGAMVSLATMLAIVAVGVGVFARRNATDNRRASARRTATSGRRTTSQPATRRAAPPPSMRTSGRVETPRVETPRAASRGGRSTSGETTGNPRMRAGRAGPVVRSDGRH